MSDEKKSCATGLITGHSSLGTQHCFSGEDRNLQIAVAVHHPPQNLGEARQGSLAGNEVAPANVTAADVLQSFPDVWRGVMKTGHQSNLGIMEQGGIHL